MSPLASQVAAATAKPAPLPTWGDMGCTGETKDPVSLGGTARVLLGCPVGAKCTLQITYPSGASAKIPAATHPKAGQWLWKWTVPESAGAGTAHGTSVCTLSGDAIDGPVTFKLVDPTPADWSINVTGVPATRSISDTDPDRITVAVIGTFPINTRYTLNFLTCQFGLESGNGAISEWIGAGEFKNGDPPMDFYVRFNGLTEENIGPGTWRVHCYSQYVTPIVEKWDSGSMEVVP